MSDLKLVIVIARHGDRAPIRAGCYPTDPHKDASYHPYGDGELTNQGKKRMFEVGQYLRKRYDKFLGSMYHPEEVKVVTSDINRTKMTAQLITSGLYPPCPKQQWHSEQNWQPIPYTCTSQSHKMLTAVGFRHDKTRVKEREKTLSDYGQKLLKPHSDLVEYVKKHAGYKNIDCFNLYVLCCTLTSEAALGFKLPDWAENKLQDIEEVGAYLYRCEMYTPELRKEIAGPVLKEIMKDLENAMENKTKTKFVLYSGHETTIAFLLIALGLFEDRVPPFGAYIILELTEVESSDDGDDYIQILYQDFEQEHPKLLTLPGQPTKCQMNIFKNDVLGNYL